MQYVRFLWVDIFLSACGLLPPLPTEPPNQITPLGSTTPSATPSVTPTPITPTVSPTSTPDPKFFRDDFNNTLDTEWSWVREDPLNWSLTALPGALQINVAGG